MKKFNEEADPEVAATQGQATQGQGQVQTQKEQGGADASETLKNLIELSKTDYTKFVQTLANDVSKDNLFPKLKALILSGKEDGKPTDEVFSISNEDFVTVSGLIPTQNEIDRNKSLKFNTTYPKMFTGDGAPTAEVGKKQISDVLNAVGVKINNLPIVLFKSDGKNYILDGHHRWSGVHALNKDGKIAAIFLESSAGIDPKRALAALQLSIAASQDKWLAPGTEPGGFPSANAGSADTNLLLASSNPETIKFLEKEMSDDFVEIVKEEKKEIEGKPVDRQVVIDFIMSNLAVMQKTGFLSGSSTRAVMPQTDGTPTLKGNQDAWKNPLKQGEINFIEDSLNTSKKWIKTYEQFRNKK